MNKTIKDIFEQLKNDLLNLEMLKYDIKYFYEASEDIKSVVFMKYNVVQRVQIVKIRALVIGLSRILNPREDYSFFSLIKMMKKSAKYKTEEEKLISINRQLTELEKSSEYKKIKTLRNKFYAHLDFKRKDFDVSISYGAIVAFLTPIEKIFNRLMAIMENAEMYFELSYLNDGQRLYECAMINHNLWGLYEKAVLNQEKTIEIEKIGEILTSRDRIISQ